MINCLFALLHLCTVTLLSSEAVIHVTIDKKWDYDRVMVNAGEPPNELSIPIDLNSKYSWLYDREKQRYHSMTMKEEKSLKETKYKNVSFNGMMVEDNLFFQEQKSLSIKLVFYLISNFTSYYKGNEGALAFPFKPIDERYSLIHQFKRGGMIDSLSFAIGRESFFIDSLNLGGIPANYTRNKTHSDCEVIGNDGYWQCSFYGMLYSNDISHITYNYTSSHTNHNDYALFDLIEPYVYVPSDFFDFLCNTIFKPHLQTSMCGFGMFKGKRILTCFNINENGNVTFLIGDYAYTFPLSRFIKFYDEYLEVNLVENPYGNYWIFGSWFMNAFNVLFDYDNKTISFYSDEDVKYLYKHRTISEERGYDGAIWKANCAVLLIGLLVLCQLRLRIGKVINNKDKAKIDK